MKIIHIGNVGLRANGVGQVIENLSAAQMKAGHEVLVLTAREKKEQLDQFREVHKHKEFSKIIDSFKPDIFIFHSLYIWEYIKFYSYLLKKKIPYLIQLHGALSKENYKKNFFKKWIANTLFFNRFIRGAQSIIYLNKNEYENSIVKGINPSTIFIPNGCPEAIIKHIKEDNEMPLEILYIGRIDFHHKGLDKLIDAIRILKNKEFSRDIHFSIYGFGEKTDMDRMEFELKDLDSIAKYYGPVYGATKYEVYNKSDIFILTSRYEGMPMGILEALSYGLPCVITKATNMEEVIDDYDCGWITDFDATDIANTIKKAIDEYKDNKLILRENCILASQKFMWSSIAKDSIKQYSKFIDKNA